MTSQDGIANVDFEGGVLNAHHDFGSVTLTSITGYDKSTVHYQQGIAATPYLQFGVGQDTSYGVFSQELRLTSEGKGPVKWIVGGFYTNEQDDLGTIAINNAIPGTPAPIVPTTELNQTANIYSVYGKADINLTSKLVLSAGLRWTDDERTGILTPRTMLATTTGTGAGTLLPAQTIYSLDLIRSMTTGATATCHLGVGYCVGPNHHLAQYLSKFGGKIGLKYDFTADVMGYVSYSRGFKSGAFDVRAQTVLLGLANKPVGPETLDAYEAGVKSTLFDRHLQLDGDVFYYNWYGLQAFVTAPGIGPEFLNLPKTRIYGAELDGELALDGGWNMNGGLTYLNSKLVNTNGLGGVTQGAPVSGAPDWRFVGAISKTMSLGDSSTLTLAANARYSSAQYSGFSGNREERVNPAAFLDLSATYELDTSRAYKIRVWGQNVTGTKTCLYEQTLETFSYTNTCVPNAGMPFYGADLEVDF